MNHQPDHISIGISQSLQQIQDRRAAAGFLQQMGVRSKGGFFGVPTTRYQQAKMEGTWWEHGDESGICVLFLFSSPRVNCFQTVLASSFCRSLKIEVVFHISQQTLEILGMGFLSQKGRGPQFSSIKTMREIIPMTMAELFSLVKYYEIS